MKDQATQATRTPSLEDRIHCYCRSKRSNGGRGAGPRLFTDHRVLSGRRGDVSGSYAYGVVDTDTGQVLAVGMDLASIARQLDLIPRS